MFYSAHMEELGYIKSENLQLEEIGIIIKFINLNKNHPSDRNFVQYVPVHVQVHLGFEFQL